MSGSDLTVPHCSAHNNFEDCPYRKTGLLNACHTTGGCLSKTQDALSISATPAASSNVVTLKGEPAPPASQRKQVFLDTVAQAFERYVATHGEEPEALVYTLSGLKQSSQIGWHMTGESQDGAVAVLAMTALHMASDVKLRLVSE